MTAGVGFGMPLRWCKWRQSLITSLTDSRCDPEPLPPVMGAFPFGMDKVSALPAGIQAGHMIAPLAGHRRWIIMVKRPQAAGRKPVWGVRVE